MKTLALIAATAAGLAAALALTAAHVANAYDIGNLPPGYTVGLTTDLAATGIACKTFYVISGYGQTVTLGFGPPAASPSGGDCNPAFQSELDAFIAATYVAPVTTTAATTTDAPTTPAAPIPPVTTTDAAPTTTAPVQTVTVVVTDPTVDARLTALEQRQTVDEQRIATLEKNAGLIVGEPKNVAPFTTPA